MGESIIGYLFSIKQTIRHYDPTILQRAQARNRDRSGVSPGLVKIMAIYAIIDIS